MLFETEGLCWHFFYEFLAVLSNAAFKSQRLTLFVLPGPPWARLWLIKGTSLAGPAGMHEQDQGLH